MKENSLLQHSKKWDRTGIVIAIACLIHCLALPFLIILMPASEVLFHNKWLEFSLFAVGITVASISFVTSYRRHRDIQPLLLGAFGVAFILTSLVDSLIRDHEYPYMTITGGALLLAGHAWNLRSCSCYCEKSCHHDHHSPSSKELPID